MRVWLPLAPLVLLLGGPAWGQATADEAPGDTLAGPEALQGHRFEHPRLTLRLTPRTPQQVAAFYEARGFPPAMVDALKARCFITVGVRNKSDDILWLALDNWRFTSTDGAVRRYDRAYWRTRWDELDAPMPAQSTFRWTLMPETHDFLPGEAEGGNVVLARSAAAMSLQATFVAGKEQDGERIAVRIDDIRCAEDPNP
ncbi:hypothetical protein HUS23_05265 [Ectothiorhodospiraceae bacterium 2226]|nr:hypothetical protein HUS23_05265 [Ectothiorhodospiraceae bacterium 2226]